MDDGTALGASPTSGEDDGRGVSAPRFSLGRALSFRNIGAIYVWVAIIAFFWILEPDTFPTVATLRSVLNNEAVTGLVAISLVIPLAAGVFDLSVGYTAGFAGVLAGWFMANSSMSPWLVIVLTLVLMLVIGAVNGFVVVVLRVNSLIGTLGTGALIFAATKWVSDEKIITERVRELSEKIARGQVWGITTPVFIMVGVMLVVAYVLEQTTTGRRWYAIGFDADAARLVGIRARMLQMVAFLISAVISGLAGIVITARVNSASHEAGASYLLPAFAAAFLGATQFRRGRFNVWGAVVAVMLLGTGRVGLSLAGAPTWAYDVFLGVVLIGAMAITRAEQQ
jgi:ribose transport system permease protein